MTRSSHEAGDATFTLSTGDPRFDPSEPILINGYRFVPASETDRASIALYLQREADRRKVPGLKRALSIMADAIKAGLDRE